jgi:hypothetical protein
VGSSVRGAEPARDLAVMPPGSISGRHRGTTDTGSPLRPVFDSRRDLLCSERTTVWTSPSNRQDRTTDSCPVARKPASRGSSSRVWPIVPRRRSRGRAVDALFRTGDASQPRGFAVRLGGGGAQRTATLELLWSPRRPWRPRSAGGEVDGRRAATSTEPGRDPDRWASCVEPFIGLAARRPSLPKHSRGWRARFLSPLYGRIERLHLDSPSACGCRMRRER